MKKDCSHEHLHCVDSRMQDGWRYRRYICTALECGARFSTAKVYMAGPMDKGERAMFDKAVLANRLTHKQARNLIEQIESGHRTLNLI